MLLHSYIVVLRFGHHEHPLLRSHVATDCIAAHGYRYAHARAHDEVGAPEPCKNSGSHIDASHSRQPLVKGERLVRYEVNAVMRRRGLGAVSNELVIRRALLNSLSFSGALGSDAR